MTIALIIIGFVLLGLYNIYTSLIKAKNNIKEAASGIDVQLKKRYDLIPNMLKTAAKYMEHEKDVFMRVTELREKALGAQNYADKFKADADLSQALKSFNVQVEAYPELKSDMAMSEAQKSMADVEEHIAAARRFYNSAVKNYKNAIEIFPSSMIAMFIGLRDIYPFFEAEEAARENIDANEYFK